MRLWSISPRLLDRKGLLALWRETLLAKKVLQGLTKGYKHHPQLIRFRQSENPLHAINAYLKTISNEAVTRKYSFDQAKIGFFPPNVPKISVTSGQLSFEYEHLLKKLKTRDPARHHKLVSLSVSPSYFKNAMFEVIESPQIEPWERT